METVKAASGGCYGVYDQLVSYEVINGIALIRSPMRQPCVFYDMMRQLNRWVLEARMDASVHVIMLTGQGEKFFCAGADIAMLQRLTPTEKYYFCLHANETLARLEQTPKLVIGALNGHTVGGGLEIAMACDLRIARQNAGKVGLPEVHLGVLPGTGGTQRLTRLLGKSKALELMVTGRNLTFSEARDMGLIHETLESADGVQFLSDALAYAEQFSPSRLRCGGPDQAYQSGERPLLRLGWRLNVSFNSDYSPLRRR